MSQYRSYPILLSLNGRRCVVIGGGVVAARKVSDLLDSGADITVISPALHPTLEALAGRISVQRAEYISGLLTELHPFLVFAATDSPEVNRQIAAEAREIGALVDSVDAGAEGDFSSMAAIHRGPITIGIATGGASPALAVHLRQQLEKAIGLEYATLAEWLAELRPLVRERLPSETARAELWRTVVASPILDDLRQGRESGARQKLQGLLKKAGL